jgi:hypothetical protein
MRTIKYRLHEPRLRPRQTKLEIPGWGGDPQPRRDGSREHVWHCMPFTEGAQYGIEVFYPLDNELHVTRRDGKLELDCDFGEDPGTGVNWPPFRNFGDNYYTYQLLLDLRVDDDMAVRTEPHPRLYSEPGDDVPIAVPALMRTSWWPMISFVVFKSPAEGRTHVFRPGEPFMQMIFVPAEPSFQLVKMTEDEEIEREARARRIHASRETLSKDTHWTSSTGTSFDGTYRHILRAAKAKAKGEE